MKIKEHPILFSGPMVKAILEGKKTQTRRVVKNCDYLETYPDGPKEEAIYLHSKDCPNFCDYACNGRGLEGQSPYGATGDSLWVRETWQEFDGEIIYKSAHALTSDLPVLEMSPRWKPSIHMPRWASRITLEITGIRVERLHKLSRKDAVCEGMKTKYSVMEFRNLWTEINGKRGYGWTTNPWVWVVKFKRVQE